EVGAAPASPGRVTAHRGSGRLSGRQGSASAAAATSFFIQATNRLLHGIHLRKAISMLETEPVSDLTRDLSELAALVRDRARIFRLEDRGRHILNARLH